MLRFKWIAAAAMVPISQFQVYAQFNETVYQPKSILEAIKQHHYLANLESDFTFNAALHRYQTIVVYEGEYRKLEVHTNNFLNDLLKSRPQLAPMLKLYSSEILISQSGKQYWLPIQDGLLSELKECRKKGQSIKVFYASAGAIKMDFIFLITRFDEID